MARLAVLATCMLASTGSLQAQTFGSTILGPVSSLPPQTPVDWVGCECPEDLVELAGWNFQNVAAGSTVPSVSASSLAPGVSATDISGPGSIYIREYPTGSGNHWGCFGGWPLDGSSDIVEFTLFLSDSIEEDCYCLSDLTFDIFSEGTERFHGPDSFEVYLGTTDALGNFDPYWGTTTIGAPYAPNVLNFALSDYQGFNFAGNTDWLHLEPGDTLTVQIYAGGANVEGAGLDIDNISVLACPGCVPEPSAAVLLGCLGLLVQFRLRRRN